MARKSNYIWIGVIIVILLAIFFTLNYNKYQDNAITCNSPYIKVGASCCLDQNSDNICDNDEQDLQGQIQQVSELSCNSKVDCASITDLRIPYHSCSLNNGCEIKNEKCVSICEGKDETECKSTTLSSINSDSTNPNEVICEWR